MKRFLWIIPVLALLGMPPSSNRIQAQDRPLSVRVLEIEGTEITRERLFSDFQVLEDLGELLVVEPTSSDKAMVRKLGLPSSVLSVPSGAGKIYIASLKDLTPSELSGYGIVLHVGKEIALMALQDEAALKLEHPVAHYGLERGVRALNLEPVPPIKPFKAPSGWTAGSRAADPRIQAMVDQVSATNLQDVVQDLEDMGERKASSGAFVAETYLVNSFDAIGGLDVNTHHYSASYSDNVIAELPGAVDPSVIIVVGGHYDSTSSSSAAPGADDNASGTSGVREIARVLSQYEFKYTIRFCAFGAEEVGLIGSDAYCDLLVSQGANVQAMVNLDMTAYRASGDTADVDFVTNYSSSSLIQFCTDMYNTYVPALGVKQGSLSGGSSDHQSFTQHGYTACFPFEDLDQYSPYIHSSNDKIGPSANDFQLAKMITQGALAALATLAAPLDLEIQHAALADSTDASGPYVVEADVSSLVSSNVTAVTLYYDTGSGFVSKSMVPSGSGDTYISSIPGKPDYGNVKYYFEAEDDQGNWERLPDGFSAEHFEFFVGYQDDVFADDFEINDNGWTHAGSGQDDWQRDVCTGNGGYDPSQAASGTKVWGNDLGPSGWNGIYQPNVNNYLESASIDCTGATGVQLRYRRWLTVQQGAADQATILVNGNEVFANSNFANHIDTEWVYHEIDISAYADNNPDVKLRFTLTTNSSVEMGGWNIDDLHVGTVSGGDVSALSSAEVYLQTSTGGSIDFALDGTAALANRIYVLVCSASGTSPGTPVGMVTLPLNWDVLTDICLANLNNPVFANFLGYLDGNGQALATLNLPAITHPSAVGLTLDFAWVTLSPIDYASNAAGILLVP